MNLIEHISNMTAASRIEKLEDTVTRRVIDHLIQSDPKLDFPKAGRAEEGDGFARIDRNGVVYYSKLAYKVLNPYFTSGVGLQFVKATNEDPTGVFFDREVRGDALRDVRGDEGVPVRLRHPPLGAAGRARHDLPLHLREDAREHHRPRRGRGCPFPRVGGAMDSEKTKVMSLRLDQSAYRRIHAYGAAKGISDSAAARELIAGGLAADGLALYSTELGAYLRGVVQPLLDQIDETLEQRNAEQEDRIARVVHRATRASIVAAIACGGDREGHLRGAARRERRGYLHRLRQAGGFGPSGLQPRGGEGPCAPWEGVASSSTSASTFPARRVGRRSRRIRWATSPRGRGRTRRPPPATSGAPRLPNAWRSRATTPERPGSTALFDQDGAVPLREARARLADADGALSTWVISVRREEADELRLGCKDEWQRWCRRELTPALATAMGVPESSVRWVAAEHENAVNSVSTYMFWHGIPTDRSRRSCPSTSSSAPAR
ncbi:MAG: hypothetical protein ACLTSX_12185 [Collinsella sp.]